MAKSSVDIFYYVEKQAFAICLSISQLKGEIPALRNQQALQLAESEEMNGHP